MSRKGLTGIGIGLLLLVIAGGGFFALKTIGADRLVREIEGIAASLPEEQTLTWESLNVDLMSLSAEIKNPVYTHMEAGIQVAADTAVVGMGIINPGKIDVQVNDIHLSSPDDLSGDFQGDVRAKVLSVKAVDRDWIRQMVTDMQDNPDMLLDTERWRTFSQGPILLEDVSATIVDGQTTTTLSLQSVKMDGIKNGVLKSLSLSDLKMAGAPGEDRVTLDSLTQGGVDIAWIAGFIGKIQNPDDRDAVLLDPESWASLNMGPLAVSNLAVFLDGENRLTLESYTFEGTQNNRVGRTTVKNMTTSDDAGTVVIGTYTDGGADLGRILAFIDDSSKGAYPPKFTSLGFTDISIEDASFTPFENPKAVFSLKRAGVIDVRENEAGIPLAVTVVVEGVSLPLSEIDEINQNEQFQRLGLKTLTASAKLAVVLDEKTKRLSVNPVKVDLGELGAAQMTLDLSGLDLTLLNSRRFDAFAQGIAFDAMTLVLKGGAKTGTLLDLVFEEKGTTRDQAVAMIRGDTPPQMIAFLGAERADKLKGALASFVENPGVFDLSIKATGTPLVLKNLDLTSEDILKTYAVDIDYTK